MNSLLILRAIHVVTGIFWAGTMFFVVSFLLPAFKDLGPDAGKMSQALQNRRMFVWLPVMALLSILSGGWLYGKRMGGGGNWAAGMEARTLGIGAITAIVAFIIGLAVTRPAMLKADKLTAEAMVLPAGAEKEAKFAAIGALRKRGMMGSRAVATLLLITVVTMAIAQSMM